MSEEKLIFHADTVESFLRPARLLEARAKWRNEEITYEDLQKIEDEEIKILVQKEVEAGLKIVTDGEFRRDIYWLDFWIGFKGMERGEGFPDRGSQRSHSSKIKIKYWHPKVTSKIEFNPNHPEFRGFEYLKNITPEGITPKVIIPSPLFCLVFREPDDPFPK
jgi:methionine synthase II (cobalamin-independent)